MSSRQPLKSGKTHPEDAIDPTRSSLAGQNMPVMRKKGNWVRSWVVVDKIGEIRAMEMGKRAILSRSGLQARDLRILDPALSYPFAIMGRQKAIVINLEHIRAIITAHDFTLLNAGDPSLSLFVEELRRRVVRRHQAESTEAQEEGAHDSTNWRRLYDLDTPPSNIPTPQTSLCEIKHFGNANGNGYKEERAQMKILPFEFVALEACLEAACTRLEEEATASEKEANSALDKLTSKISTLNLDRVRHIKNRLVAITGRVQKVRDELEHLLDDDEDMAAMYLTLRLAQQNLTSASGNLTENDDTDDDEAPLDDRDGDEVPVEDEDDPHDSRKPQVDLLSTATNNMHGSQIGTHGIITKHQDIRELEMLLEAYFVQIDSTVNRLSALREYVDDTEDYINIMLDEQQNQLLQMGVLLTTGTMVLTALIVFYGIMGMNVRIHLFNDVADGMPNFYKAALGGPGGALMLYLTIVFLYRCKGLIV